MKYFYLITLICTLGLYSQNDATPIKDFTSEFYGFARVDYSWDTRQSAQVREYHLNLWPLDVKPDANGEDINDAGANNFLSLVTRLGVKFSGPDVWGAKATGLIEGDFFGNTEQTIALLRLRHAYGKLEWDKTAITMGLTWYPQFIPEVFPGVANFSTGIPFNPFGWATQFRVDQKLDQNFTFSFIAHKDREFGAIPADNIYNSGNYRSMIPNLHGKIQYKSKHFLAGLGYEFRQIKPLLESNNLKSDEVLRTQSMLGYFKYNHEKFYIKGYGIRGENLTNFVMLGGYVGFNDGVNPMTYKGTITNSCWFEIASNNPKRAPGLFFGYTNQEGISSSDSPTDIFARGINSTRAVKSMWRSSARIDFKQNKMRITPEIEYTSATHADTQPNLSISGNENVVGNFRATVSMVYSF